MTKKIMMVAVLLGALTLGACVDNKESASVEAVRNAKAEQLKGLAALANAQAEAEKITAEAEAALKNAKAEFQKNETEQAKQKFAIRIEAIKAQAEAEIAEAKSRALIAEKEILANADAIVKELYAEYKYYADELATTNHSIITKTGQLAKLEAGIITAEANAKLNNIYLNRSIAEQTAKLEVLNDPSYESIDLDALTAKRAVVQQKLDLENSRLANNEGAALDATAEAVKAAVDVKNESAMKTINDLDDLYPGIVTYKSNEYLMYEYQNTANSAYIQIGAYINETNLLFAKRTFAANLKTKADALGTSADTRDKATAYGRLAAANYQMETAKGMPETTDAEKDAKKNAIEAAELQIAICIDDLATAQTAYDEQKADTDKFNAALSALDLATYNTAVDNIIALVDANEVSKKAFDKASETQIKLNAEYGVISSLIYNSRNVAELKATCELSIASNKESIEANLSGIPTAEAQLAKEKEEIATLQKKAETLKISVANAKAALDAGIAK